jgi:hypothetical protein
MALRGALEALAGGAAGAPAFIPAGGTLRGVREGAPVSGDALQQVPQFYNSKRQMANTTEPRSNS